MQIKECPNCGELNKVVGARCKKCDTLLTLNTIKDLPEGEIAQVADLSQLRINPEDYHSSPRSAHQVGISDTELLTMRNAQFQASGTVEFAHPEYKKIFNDIRKWGIGLLVFGLAFIIITILLEQISADLIAWEFMLIVAGLSSFYFRSTAMYVIFSGLLGWAAISNVLSEPRTWWIILLQGGLAIETFRKYLNTRQLEIDLLKGDTKEKNIDVTIFNRSARFFPLISCLLGSISMIGFCLFLGIGINEGISGNAEPSNGSSLVTGILFSFAILGFTTGLASLLQRYRQKALRIIGISASTIIIMWIIIAGIFL